MLKVILAVVAAAAVILTANLADAAPGSKRRSKTRQPAPPPQACVEQREEKLWRPLSETTPAIIANIIEFERDGHLYPLKAFSAMARNPKSNTQSCLRYDVANVGRLDIARLIWPV